MFQSNNHNNSDQTLRKAQIEALKSLSQLLIREISSLEEIQANLAAEINRSNRISLNTETQRFEIELIRCALIRTMGKQNQAARLLGLKNSTLSDKIKRYKIDIAEVLV